MIKLKSILTEQSTPIVVFVSGLTKYESVDAQGNRIQSGMPGFQVITFHYNDKEKIIKYLKDNNAQALILYSKSCEYWKTYKPYINNIFCIEPWNGSNKMVSRYSGFPVDNMWVGPEDYRGNGLKTNNDIVPGKGTRGHIEALSVVAPLIARKI